MTSPTLTRRGGGVKSRDRHKYQEHREPKAIVLARKRTLAAAGATYEQLAILADVSYSMTLKWMGGRRKSEKCQRAYDRLTGAAAKGAV